MTNYATRAAAGLTGYWQASSTACSGEVLTVDGLLQAPDLLAQVSSDGLGDIFHLLTAADLPIGDVLGHALDHYIEERAEEASDEDTPARNDLTIAPRVLADLVTSPMLKFVHSNPAVLLRQALALVEESAVYLVEFETEACEGLILERCTTDLAHAVDGFRAAASRLGAGQVVLLRGGEMTAVDDQDRWNARVLLRVLHPDAV